MQPTNEGSCDIFTMQLRDWMGAACIISASFLSGKLCSDNSLGYTVANFQRGDLQPMGSNPSASAVNELFNNNDPKIVWMKSADIIRRMSPS